MPEGAPEPRGITSDAGGVELPLLSGGRELGGEPGGSELFGGVERRAVGSRCRVSSTCGAISEKPRPRRAALVRSNVTEASAAKPRRRCSCISSTASSTSNLEVLGKPSMASDQAVRSGATARFEKSAI